MPVIELTDTACPQLAPYMKLTEAQLRNRLNPKESLFIAESPKVIRVALDAGHRPASLLCEPRHITGDAADIIARIDNEIPVYTGSRELLASMTGYTLTRGVLCAMHRPEAPDPATIFAGAHRIAVIDGVTDTTNIGAIFRSAAALGIDAIALTPTTCDPLNRRSVRVSMGSVFLVPWTWISADMHEIRSLGFKLAAMALTDKSIGIDAPELTAEPRLAIVLGTEGDGLSHQAIAGADFVVKIPMAHGVDSLNVAAASAVAFWQLRQQP
ncbi:MAG: RNA methyltransferase [Muribaculaceae bacterium]|nr:RNA methyltransferase [Muribaculaceae bacterium]